VSAGGTYGRDANVDLILELTGRKPVTDWVFDDLLDMSYEVIYSGMSGRSIEAARANAGAVAAARDTLKVTVAAETVRAYAEVCTLGEEIAVAEHSLEVISREEEITAARHDAGAKLRLRRRPSAGARGSSPSDVADAAWPTSRGTTPARGAHWPTPSAAPDNVLSCSTAPRLASLVPIGDGALLLRRRPDVREAERQPRNGKPRKLASRPRTVSAS